MSASQNNGSRATPTGGNGANNNDRPRLTDAEKKQNHIISEQKRRQAIRQGFDRLASMTPGMEGQGRSEANVLAATVAEIKRQTILKDRIKRKVMGENPTMTEKDFEAFYAQTARSAHNSPVAPVAPALPTASTPKSKGKARVGSEGR